MGSCMLKDGIEKGLSIASLNYSGVQESPYEFYETENQEEKHLSSLFEEVCSKQYPPFKDPKFKWGIGKMDKQWHTRFSPLYNERCGIKDNKLMTKEEFYHEWEQNFKMTFAESENKIYSKLKGEQRQKTIQKDKQQCKIFDYCVYKSIVMKVQHVEDIQPGISSEKFQLFQKMKFIRPFLSEDLKIKYTLNSLKKNDVDILFLQEGNEKILGAIYHEMEGKFHIVERMKENCTSAILINKEKINMVKDFQEQNQKFYKNFEARTGVPDAMKFFYLNEDTVLQAIGKVVFLSVHLSSKKELNPNQLDEMNKVFGLLLEKFPDYHFMIGSDLNGNYKIDTRISCGGKEVPLFVFPDSTKEATVMKKRTMLQVQKHKANELNDGVKDYLVSNFKLSETHIQTIKGNQVKKGKNLPLLPNSDHPYDHYLLSCQMEYRKEYFTHE